MSIRRIVTAEIEGKSVVLSDETSPNTYDYQSLPGFSTSLIWSSNINEQPFITSGEPAGPGTSFLPGTGETKFMIVSFPPDSIFSSPDFDFQAAVDEQVKNLVGLVGTFEAENPGMHKTHTIDYAIVLSGRITLELDDGKMTHLCAGDVVVQQGCRHAWRNSSDEVATLAFTLVGVK